VAKQSKVRIKENLEQTLDVKGIDLAANSNVRGRSGKLIEPCLLLLLHEKPSHGYELIEKLAEFGFSMDAPDPGTVYRNLRRMEEEGIVESSWLTEGPGPAKRLYKVTLKAAEELEEWAVDIQKNIEKLESFLQRKDIVLSQRKQSLI